MIHKSNTVRRLLSCRYCCAFVLWFVLLHVLHEQIIVLCVFVFVLILMLFGILFVCLWHYNVMCVIVVCSRVIVFVVIFQANRLRSV